MSYVILDLEWNGSYSKREHRYVNEIIEFGAVKTDDKFNITDTFSMLISPQIGKKLCAKVKSLTRITNEELQNEGYTFMHAVSEFQKFLEDSVLLTWGTSDILALIENYAYYEHKSELPFLKSYCNLQEYCESCLGIKNASSQLGLSACAEMLSISFDAEEQHRAFADAELSLKCLTNLIDRFPIEPFISDATKSIFYDRMLFKTHFLTDIDNPEVDKKKMFFDCEECGKRAKKTSAWKVRNKCFVADFVCENCNKKFTGKISFKKKFDCVVVKKRISEQKSDSEKKSEAVNT